jgi:hypothetical protein
MPQSARYCNADRLHDRVATDGLRPPAAGRGRASAPRQDVLVQGPPRTDLTKTHPSVRPGRSRCSRCAPTRDAGPAAGSHPGPEEVTSGPGPETVLAGSEGRRLSARSRQDGLDLIHDRGALLLETGIGDVGGVGWRAERRRVDVAADRCACGARQ